ncbi:hypothetical protein OKA04_00870 [Luteolibacter flavescens]|uniref:SURF1-like protein n=1 Tax=Luteolibacter flavescens TaxID=1859460 RepID=A0ABT3FIS7_9BACT|nr:hypothetical protein [Luteolibacter flavescens]MCW1883259.1 hypothetical protein [Luteolibacter flavescens]
MPPQQDATPRSPLAGCLILVLALLMLVGLIGFTAWMPFRQAEEIEKFTKSAPAPVEVDVIEGNEAKVSALVERLEAFRSDLNDESGSARIELTAEDLNLAIAAFPQVEQLRKSFRVREITGEHLIIDICYQLNGRPRLAKDGEEGFMAADPFYLIGTIKGRPELARRELALRVDSLDVPGSTVPQGFLDHFSTLRLFEMYLKDPILGPAMAKMTRAEIQDGKMILARVPGENPPEVVTDANFKQGSQRFFMYLGIAACLFLAFAATMIYQSIKRQKRLEREGGSPGEGR